MKSDHLTPEQRTLLSDLESAAEGRDARDVLRDEFDAPAADKAAVSEVLGGPGAGAEFLEAK
ncbi:hypothetical protein [Winogradskya humida]|uniref:Uncharacterized protein n=1 Tax=Winogradskya humida TaxID=113566 RepID=A0ABQ4A788_9ACTN|nr:hypothetical protein [Actinoplanes humidus]GIE26730.1 hypothetical protein Ahu01nite_098320 [Actinoplanes humidus]